MQKIDRAVLFGGTGFIGTHFSLHLLRGDLARKIVLVDIAPPRVAAYASQLTEGLKTGKVEFAQWDVRNPVPASLLPDRVDLVANFAAIHREPGHLPKEYFETNILGAENVCAYAATTHCPRVLFTSSISPYGPCEEAKDESALPTPESPYGASKLCAEKIHMVWKAADPGRKLVIIRPGVVFGPGEGGNVTRLVRSLVRGYFAYMGNRNVRKAGGYVKELSAAMQFCIEHQESSGEDLTLANFSMDPPFRVEEIVNAVRQVAGIHGKPFSVPRSLLLAASYPIASISGVLGIKQPIDPARVRKLFRSTNIAPVRLRELGYQWTYDLQSALKDWQKEQPSDFMK